MAGEKYPLVAVSSSRECSRQLVLNVALIGLGGIHYGYNIGVIGAAFEAMEAHGNAVLELSALSSATLLGSIIGSPLSARVSECIGLVGATIIGEASSILGALGCSISSTPQQMMLCRVLIGIGVGFCTLAKPLYVAHTTRDTPGWRAAVLGSFPAWIGLGLAMANIAANTLAWRMALGIGALPALALLLVAVSPAMTEPASQLEHSSVDPPRTINADESSQGLTPALASGIILAAGNQLTGQYGITVYASAILSDLHLNGEPSLELVLSYSNIASAVAALPLTKLYSVPRLLIVCNVLGTISYLLVATLNPSLAYGGLFLKALTHQAGPGAGYFVLAPNLGDATTATFLYSASNTFRYIFEFTQSFGFVPALEMYGLRFLAFFFASVSTLCAVHAAFLRNTQ